MAFYETLVLLIISTMRDYRVQPAVEAMKYDHPSTQGLEKKENQHKPSRAHIPTFWSLLLAIKKGVLSYLTLDPLRTT